MKTNSFDPAGRLGKISDGTNSAAYSYLANSMLVGQIGFTNSGATAMTTSKSYDYLNRLTGMVSTEPSDQIENGFGGFWPAVDQRNYSYNAANQRIGVTNVDGSYWAYGYDGLGQVTNGVKFWSDGTKVAGQKFLYTFDTIGNRLSTQAGVDASGANLRLAYYTNNLLNQITSRDVPGSADIMGLNLATNTVSVNGTNAYQKGEYFREQMGTNNSSAAQWVGINVSAPGQTTVSGRMFVAQEPENFTYDADGNLTQCQMFKYDPARPEAAALFWQKYGGRKMAWPRRNAKNAGETRRNRSFEQEGAEITERRRFGIEPRNTRGK